MVGEAMVRMQFSPRFCPVHGGATHIASDRNRRRDCRTHAGRGRIVEKNDRACMLWHTDETLSLWGKVNATRTELSSVHLCCRLEQLSWIELGS